MSLSVSSSFATQPVAIQFGQDDEKKSAYGGRQSVLTHAPVVDKRDLSESELFEINHRKEHAWWPRFFPTDETPLTERVANPVKKGAIVGGIVGGAVYLINILNQAQNSVAAGWGLLTGGISGTAAGVSQKIENERVVGTLKYLPENATERDLEADPAHQARLDRRNRLEAASIAAAGRNSWLH